MELESKKALKQFEDALHELKELIKKYQVEKPKSRELLSQAKTSFNNTIAKFKESYDNYSQINHSAADKRQSEFNNKLKAANALVEEILVLLKRAVNKKQQQADNIKNIDGTSLAGDGGEAAAAESTPEAAEVEKIQEELHNLQVEVSKLKEEASKSKVEVATLNVALQKSHESTKEAQKKQEKAEKKDVDQARQITELNKQLEEMTKACEGAQKIIESKDEEIKNVRVQLQEKIDEVSVEKTAHQNLKTQMQEAEVKAASEIQALGVWCRNLEWKLDIKRTDMERRVLELALERELVKKLNSEIVELRNGWTRVQEQHLQEKRKVKFDGVTIPANPSGAAAAAASGSGVPKPELRTERETRILQGIDRGASIRGESFFYRGGRGAGRGSNSSHSVPAPSSSAPF